MAILTLSLFLLLENSCSKSNLRQEDAISGNIGNIEKLPENISDLREMDLPEFIVDQLDTISLKGYGYNNDWFAPMGQEFIPKLCW